VGFLKKILGVLKARGRRGKMRREGLDLKNISNNAPFPPNSL
jgi:hypothetical protein